MLWMTCAIVICVFITKYGENLMHMTLFGRPIFIGFVAGLLLGDMQTGILIGAQLELAFMGIVIIGATAAADPAIATTQMSSPRQKEICLGLDYFLVYLPSCSNSDTKIMCPNRLLQQK